MNDKIQDVTTLKKNQNQEAVRQFFTETAADYSKFFLPDRSGRNFGFRERMRLAGELTANANGRLLDCACGSGEITAAILNSKRFPSGTIVDLSPQMLQMTRQRMENQFGISDFCKLEFVLSDIFAFVAKCPADHYDLILCLGLVAHIGRMDELLLGLSRVLRPGGKILFQSSLLDHSGNRLVRWLSHERYYRQHGYRISYYHHKDIVQSAVKSGLTISAASRFTLGVPFGDRLSARLNYHLEKAMSGWSRSHGAEGLYLMQK